MLVLGIDTSCDDTTAGVVKDGKKVLSNVIHSQIQFHSPHGGVVPELASREHLRNIIPVIDGALDQANIRADDVDGVAVTVGPGLVGSLLVGLYYSKAFAYSKAIPICGVNHLEGHILSIFLEEDYPEFPFVALTVSGGHTSLYLVSDYGRYRLLGQTLDDAAGEAFDKVAKILGLGYPGGPVIEKEAEAGDGSRVTFPRAFMTKDSLDFSFSGLKTAVGLYVKKWRADVDGVTIHDIAASFQEAVADVLVHKLLTAMEKAGVHRAMVAGGVACNNRLRERFKRAAENKGAMLYVAKPAFCTDNGAMIAVAGFHRLMAGQELVPDMDVRSKYPISDLFPLDRGE